MSKINSIIQGDALTILKKMKSGVIDCCITSPPYFGLRDYGIDNQFGLEGTPEEYIINLVEVFREVKRVLKNGGTCWLNLGDSYAGSGKGRNADGSMGKLQSKLQRGNMGSYQGAIPVTKDIEGIKPKNLIGIPWAVAFALRTDGWYLRQDIIWEKTNPMPESVSDRCTKSHEYVFLLTKSPKYYFDNEAIKEKTVTKDNSKRDRDNSKLNNPPGRTRMAGLKTNDYELRNKRDVWTISTKPFPFDWCPKCKIKVTRKERGEKFNHKLCGSKLISHFAIFPPDLVGPMILAGCPENGIVLDPFMGSGTTAVVARKLGRNYFGIELNPDYIEIAEKRIEDESRKTSK